MVANLINSTQANASRSLEAFQALAKSQTLNLPGGAVSNGTAGSTSNTGNSGNSGSGSSTTSGGTAQSTNASAAAAIEVSRSLLLGGAVAMVMALWV